MAFRRISIGGQTCVSIGDTRVSLLVGRVKMEKETFFAHNTHRAGGERERRSRKNPPADGETSVLG